QNLRATEISDSYYNLPPLWKPEKNVTLAQFAARFGISADRLAWASRNNEVPEELQKRLVSRLQYARYSPEIPFMEELHSFETDEYQRGSVLEAIVKRRMPLDQELKM